MNTKYITFRDDHTLETLKDNFKPILEKIVQLAEQLDKEKAAPQITLNSTDYAWIAFTLDSFPISGIFASDSYSISKSQLEFSIDSLEYKDLRGNTQRTHFRDCLPYDLINKQTTRINISHAKTPAQIIKQLRSRLIAPNLPFLQKFLDQNNSNQNYITKKQEMIKNLIALGGSTCSHSEDLIWFNNFPNVRVSSNSIYLDRLDCTLEQFKQILEIMKA